MLKQINGCPTKLDAVEQCSIPELSYLVSLFFSGNLSLFHRKKNSGMFALVAESPMPRHACHYFFVSSFLHCFKLPRTGIMVLAIMWQVCSSRNQPDGEVGTRG